MHNAGKWEANLDLYIISGDWERTQIIAMHSVCIEVCW
jgi:hypothetical protein